MTAVVIDFRFADKLAHAIEVLAGLVIGGGLGITAEAEANSLPVIMTVLEAVLIVALEESFCFC